MENPFGPRQYGSLEPVSPRVFCYRNIVNSAVVVGERGFAIVDTQVNRALAARLLAAARRVTDKPLLYAINTHYHWDHTNGNHVFAEAGATLVSGARTKRYMVERAPRQKAFLASRGFALGPDPDLPEVTYEGSLELDLGGQRLRLSHMGSAETDDATTVHLPDENLLVAGDTVMTGSFPIFGQPVMNEGLMSRAWLDTLAKIRAVGASAILTGHGPVARGPELDLLERIEEYFLVETKACVDRGLPLEALLAEMEAALPAWIRELAEVWGTPRYAILRVWRGLVDEAEPGWQHRKPSAIPVPAAGELASKVGTLSALEDWTACCKEALEGGDVPIAIAVAREATRRFPGEPAAWVAFGRMLMDGSRVVPSVLEKGDFFVEAKAAWEKAQDLRPDFGPGHLLEAQMLVFTAYRNGDDPEPGEAKVRRALELGLSRGDEGRAHFLLGLVARTRGDEVRAVDSFKGALERDPGFFPARLALA
jgi:cyclase